MKNWRTTLIGAITAIVNSALPLMATGQIDWKAVAISAGMAAMGIVAKDAGVSGTER